MTNRKVETINPYDSDVQEPKHVQVRRMFDNIAHRYDVLNRVMTCGIDRNWRRVAVDALSRVKPRSILDIATGTGDLAISMACRYPESTVTGVDLSSGMIAVGIEKVERARLESRVKLMEADALKLPFADGTFDAVTVAFGVRNFEHIDRGYREMLRVLRAGGMLCVLELTPPSSSVLRPFYNLYTSTAIPLAGWMLSGDASAYKYLPRSIAAAPVRSSMTEIMTEAGFKDCQFRDFFPGVCALYTAFKP